MSQPMEWSTRDKSAWLYGAWMEEPDKVQWVDGATGLDCLIVRGPSGALCGYVGVPETHPWYRKGYSECTQPEPCGDSWCDHAPTSRISVHGGLTFSASCHEATREEWEDMRARQLPLARAEAVKYPNGDAARYVKQWEPLADDYEAFRGHMVASAICHLPLPGRPDHVWWFGFDCAHSDDLCPAYEQHGFFGDGWYKDRAYVERECADLAKQLAAVGGDRESA